MQNTQTVLLRIMECSGWKGFARSPVPPHPFRDEEAAAQRGEPACLQWQLTGSRGAQVSGALPLSPHCPRKNLESQRREASPCHCRSLSPAKIPFVAELGQLTSLLGKWPWVLHKTKCNKLECDSYKTTMSTLW